MATKEQGIKCYDNAAPDEPLFVLRATDPFAPVLVRRWANLAEMSEVVPQEKILDARKCADAMERWPIRKYPD